MIDPKELKKIVRFCQKNGIIKFKSGDFEIEIAAQRLVATSSQREKDSAVPAPESFPAWESLTPEQRLLWSATPDLNQV